MRRPLLIPSWVLIGASAVFRPAEAYAEPPAPDTAALRGVDHLVAAEKLYGELDFSGAARAAEAALAGGGLSKEQVVRSYRLLAIARSALDDASGARAAFVTLLGVEPAFVVDANLGPRVTSPFEEAKAFWATQQGRPTLAASASAKPGGPGVIRISVRNPLGFFKDVRAGHRLRGTQAFTMTSVPPGDTSIPIEATQKAAMLEYFVVGLDAQNNVLAASGTEASPQTLFIDAPPPPKPPALPPRRAPEQRNSVFASGWFWGVVGVVVLGGAAVGYAATRPPQPPTSALAAGQIWCGAGPCR